MYGIQRRRRYALKTGALVGALLGVTLLGACDDSDNDDPTQPEGPSATVVTASGDITARVNEFRSLLGEPLNTTPGQQPTGRREINWDAVPGTFTNADNFPGNFFNSVDPAAPAGRKRGAVFATPGTSFRVSDNDFGDVNATYDGGFDDFSPTKTFMPTSNNVLDTRFFVAGTDTAALVNGFGVVFSDVDAAGTARLEFYGADGRSLGIAQAPVHSDAGGFSFVGVVWDQPIVARVRIVSGTAALGPNTLDVSNGGSADLVVMDDFLYGEPRKQ